MCHTGRSTFQTLAALLSICAIVFCAGCEPGQESAPNTDSQPDMSARLGPGEIPGAVYGIRVNGTEAHPTYGYVSPGGDTVCCWPTLVQAEIAGARALTPR